MTVIELVLDDTGSGSGERPARAATAADFAVGQLVNQAVASTDIVDILAACGLDRPDIAVLSDEFLAELISPPPPRIIRLRCR